MKKVITFFITIFCSVLLQLTVFAHPGSLDEYGGHYDHSTGEYHYHHGYSAHSHEGGTCPYEFKDDTDRSNHGSSSSGKSYDDDFTKPEDETHITGVYIEPEESTEDYKTIVANRKKRNNTILIIFASLAAASLVLFLIFRIRRAVLYKKAKTTQLKEWNGRSKKEIIGYPFDISVKNDNLVYLECTNDNKYGYYTFYYSEKSKYIHKKNGCDNASVSFSVLDYMSENGKVPALPLCPKCKELYLLSDEDIEIPSWHKNYLTFVFTRKKYDIPYYFFSEDIISEEEIKIREIEIQNKITAYHRNLSNNLRLIRDKEARLPIDIFISKEQHEYKVFWEYLYFYFTDNGKPILTAPDEEEKLNKMILSELIKDKDLSEILPTIPRDVFVYDDFRMYFIGQSSLHPYGNYTVFKAQRGNKLHKDFGCSHSHTPVNILDYSQNIKIDKNILCSRCFFDPEDIPDLRWYDQLSTLYKLLLHYEIKLQGGDM